MITNKQNNECKLHLELIIKEKEKNEQSRVIAEIITHDRNESYGSLYYVTKIGYKDKVIFPIPSTSIELLHKADSRQINQYNSTNQYKKLFDARYKLSDVMDKEKKRINNELFPLIKEK